MQKLPEYTLRPPHFIVTTGQLPAMRLASASEAHYHTKPLKHASQAAIPAGTSLECWTIFVDGNVLYLAALGSIEEGPRLFWIEGRDLVRDGQDLRDIALSTPHTGQLPEEVDGEVERLIGETAPGCSASGLVG